MLFAKTKNLFSFNIDGVSAFDTEHCYEEKFNGNALVKTYLFGGLKFVNTVKKHEKYGAYEWVNHIENVSDKPSGIISDLWDCDCDFAIEREEKRGPSAFLPSADSSTRIYAPSGSFTGVYEFFADVDKAEGNEMVNYISVGQTKHYSATTGRSSEGANAPFFNVSKNGKGYVFAVGWTGCWECEISRGEQSIRFRSKVKDTHFRLLPGESVRTSSVVVMPYVGDVFDAQNKWRRLVREEYSVKSIAEAHHGPFCSLFWGGTRSQSIIDKLGLIKKYDLPFDYIWLDAGWYGRNAKVSENEFESDWWAHVGDWSVNRGIHPNGLKDVSDAVHGAGKRLLLWFETERARPSTDIAKEHPEYFIANSGEDVHLLLNLGNPLAFKYCFEQLSSIIEELRVDCYRQDFNIDPLNHWRSADAEDRRGITEIKHINGLYKLLDMLLEKFPSLLIDNCASGGRRIDVEMMKRSVALWRSDYQCPANYKVEVSQCHHSTFNSWLVFSGTGTGRVYDESRVRSAYDSSLNFSYTLSESDGVEVLERNVEFIKKYADEYVSIRDYFCEDFYPLTEVSDKKDVWCATQFNRPSANDGIVQVFRREKSPCESARFVLRGIDESKTYLIEDLDGDKALIKGEVLAKTGLEVRLERRSAKIFKYVVCDQQ